MATSRDQRHNCVEQPWRDFGSYAERRSCPCRWKTGGAAHPRVSQIHNPDIDVACAADNLERIFELRNRHAGFPAILEFAKLMIQLPSAQRILDVRRARDIKRRRLEERNLRFIEECLARKREHPSYAFRRIAREVGEKYGLKERRAADILKPFFID